MKQKIIQIGANHTNNYRFHRIDCKKMRALCGEIFFANIHPNFFFIFWPKFDLGFAFSNQIMFCTIPLNSDTNWIISW